MRCNPHQNIAGAPPIARRYVVKRGADEAERFALEQQRAKTAQERASKAKGREDRAARRKQTKIEEVSGLAATTPPRRDSGKARRRLSVDTSSTRSRGNKADRLRAPARSPTKQKMARTPPGLIRSPRTR